MSTAHRHEVNGTNLITPPVEGTSRLVQGFEFYRRPLDFLSQCSRRHGHCFTVWPPGFPAPMTILSDPDAVGEIFAADGTDLIESGSIAAPMMEPLIGKHAMLILDGAKHQRHRALTMPFFARGQFARFGDDILRLAADETSRWPEGTRIPLRDGLKKITVRIILRVIFGERSEPVLDSDLMTRFFGRDPSALMFMRWMQMDLGPLSPWGQFLRVRRRFYQAIEDEMKRRQEHSDAAISDVLDAMMSARDEAGQGLAQQEIIDEIFTLILAGNDTTATAIAWAAYHIFTNAGVLTKLRAELDSVRPGEFDAARIIALPYLDATVKEVLRISPIFSIVIRRLTQPTSLGGYQLPAGALVAPCIYLVHHRADLWRNPDRFEPERFVDQRHPADHFFPFGGGIRHCIGSALATYEMKLILTRIVSEFDMSLERGYVPKPRWIGNFLGPIKNLPVVLTRRRASTTVGGAFADP
jgi:cytochrome P450 family 110